MWIYLFVLVFVCKGQTREATLMQARGLSDLISLEKRVNERKLLRARCRIEKNKNWFPENCYRLLDLKLSSPQSAESLQREQIYLSQRCLKFYKGIQEVSQLKRYLNELPLAQDCQKALESHLLDMQYIGADLEKQNHNEQSLSEESLL